MGLYYPYPLKVLKYLETSETATSVMQVPNQVPAYNPPTRPEQSPWRDFTQVAYNCFQKDMT